MRAEGAATVKANPGNAPFVVNRGSLCHRLHMCNINTLTPRVLLLDARTLRVPDELYYRKCLTWLQRRRQRLGMGQVTAHKSKGTIASGVSRAPQW